MFNVHGLRPSPFLFIHLIILNYSYNRTNLQTLSINYSTNSKNYAWVMRSLANWSMAYIICKPKMEDSLRCDNSICITYAPYVGWDTGYKPTRFWFTQVWQLNTYDTLANSMVSAVKPRFVSNSNGGRTVHASSWAKVTTHVSLSLFWNKLIFN